ncbi:MAG TPA: prolyl oligopeptidase family serine peptidase [Opitutaceae bacterium]|nr:prolyl oligopeptidase family serine peptidase [Opitutaceae bacterium]
MKTPHSQQPAPAPIGLLRKRSLAGRWSPCLALSAILTVPSLAQWNYPATKTVAVTDTYFGRTYKDPYRWLESLKDKDVEAWFKAQAELTDGILARIPGRDALVEEWTALDKLQPATYRSIIFENGRVFYKKTLGGENVGKLYFREGWSGEEKLLVDPGTYRAGVTTTIQSMVPSFDGRYVALGFTSGGAEYSELRVLDVDHVTYLPDRIPLSAGPMGWTLDNTGFFYDSGKLTDTRSLDFKLNRKSRLHRLGADISADVDLFSNESNPELGITPKEMPATYIDETYPNYIFGELQTAQKEMRVYYAPASDLGRTPLKWEVLCQTSDNLVQGFECHGDYVYAVTHEGAPNYRVVRTQVRHPDWKHAETVVAEATDAVRSIEKTRDFLFVTYSNGIEGRIVKVDFSNGKTSPVPLPSSGIVGLRCPDPHSNRCLVAITSWTFPTTLYDYDGGAGTIAKSIFNTAVDYPGFENLVSEEVEVPGHDGVMVPLSIIHVKGLALDGKNSCILTGYGAYGISQSPSFSILDSVALRGVVLGIAHVRGGGEKGESWYKAGFKTTKANTWMDFISCAEFLIKQGYTSPRRLAGAGTSAGGILISRAITERPDLFAAAVCNVGDANAMRLEFRPNGPGNIPEFGTVKDPVECAALYEMDGVQHVQPGSSYPALLGVGGWNDARVPAWLPGKLVAAVQAASDSGKPVLMKVNYDNGHFTEEKTVTFRNFAGQYAFMLWQTGHKDFQPAN